MSKRKYDNLEELEDDLLMTYNEFSNESLVERLK